MKIEPPLLDCSSAGSARASLAVLFATDENELVDAVAPMPADDDHFAARFPFLSFIEGSGFTCRRDASAVWFHLARCSDPSQYTSGILPLPDALEHVWSCLAQCAMDHVKRACWEQFRQRVELGHPCHHGRLYHMKVSGAPHWGPYGMLIRESAFCAKQMGNHDYLAVPEIVEDICICAKQEFGVDLLPIYRQRTVPIIVSFVAPGLTDDVVDSALGYVWATANHRPLSHRINTCFDGRGVKIGPEQVLSAELCADP